MKKGFTLIELMVVIAILSLLAVAALVAINPAEAQKKARDSQRFKDMATIQAIVEQYLTDNPGTVTLTNKDSSGGVKTCSAGWLKDALGASLCAYANVLPTDPANRGTTVTTNTGADLANTNAYYYVRFAGGAYKICTYLESKANYKKLNDDGESTANNVFSVFSLDSIVCP